MSELVKNWMHLNGDLLCSCAIKTTHPDPSEGDIVSFTLLPLDYDLRLTLVHPLVDIKIKPINPYMSKMKFNQVEYAKLVLDGIDPYSAAELLVQWFDRLKIQKGKPTQKKCVIVTYGAANLAMWLYQWLGYKTFDLIFDHRIRSLECASNYTNDANFWNGFNYTYGQISYISLGNSTGVNCHKSDSTYQRAVNYGLMYKSMLERSPITKGDIQRGLNEVHPENPG